MPNYTDPELPADQIEDSGADAEVITSTGGNGTQFEAVQTEPNVPGWEEDANSPFTLNTASDTYTLAGTYDRVIIFIADIDAGTSTEELTLQLNGDGGANYDYVYKNGTQTSGDTSFRLTGTILYTGSGEVQIAGSWVGACDIQNGLSGLGSDTSSGYNSNVTSPLDSFTLSSGGSALSGTVHVYGWNA